MNADSGTEHPLRIKILALLNMAMGIAGLLIQCQAGDAVSGILPSCFFSIGGAIAGAALIFSAPLLLGTKKIAITFCGIYVYCTACATALFVVDCILMIVFYGTRSTLLVLLFAAAGFPHMNPVYALIVFFGIAGSPKVRRYYTAEGGKPLYLSAAVLFTVVIIASARLPYCKNPGLGNAGQGCTPHLDPGHRSRVLVLSDIGNEPDDQQSLVRLLTYANEFDIEGLIATTSCFQPDRVSPELMRKVILAYSGSPRDNLMLHTGSYYPTGNELLGLVKSGLPSPGMEGVGQGKDSEGSEWMIRIMEKDDRRPLWIAIWGGANCLAQSLWRLKSTKTADELNAIIKRLRIYAIGDQDDSGIWLRDNFPDLFYIVHPNRGKLFIPSVRIFRESTWCGISGEHFYHFKGSHGPDSSLVDDAWLNEYVRKRHGPLGEAYPEVQYIMEGDTPSFLNLVQNGLRSIQSPSFGGWGGRYRSYIPDGESRPVYSDDPDTVVVGAGHGMLEGDCPGTYRSNQSTLWRWRRAYQHDFAARMDWASHPRYEDANHPPVVVIRGNPDSTIRPGGTVLLDASGTHDPDNDALRYRWFRYLEAGTFRGNVSIASPDADKTAVSFSGDNEYGMAHIILEVSDDGKPALYRYARFIVAIADR